MGQTTIGNVSVTLQLDKISNHDLLRIGKQIDQEISVRNINKNTKSVNVSQTQEKNIVSNQDHIFILANNYNAEQNGPAYVACLYIDEHTDKPERYFYNPKYKDFLNKEKTMFNCGWMINPKRKTFILEMKIFNHNKDDNKEWWLFQNGKKEKLDKIKAFSKLRALYNAGEYK